jgi:hypothetical protein
MSWNQLIQLAVGYRNLYTEWWRFSVARTTYEPRRAYFTSLCMRIRGKLFAGEDLRTQSGGAPPARVRFRAPAHCPALRGGNLTPSEARGIP